jgi:DNA mismatch repair protein MutS2
MGHVPSFWYFACSNKDHIPEATLVVGILVIPSIEPFSLRIRKFPHKSRLLVNHQKQIQSSEVHHPLPNKLIYLKDMERKLKALIIEWRKSDNKDVVIKMMHTTLTGQKEKYQAEKQQKKINEKFLETDAQVNVGNKVKMKQNKQVGIVKELRGKKALLQVGVVPMLVSISDLIVVMDKPVVDES